MQTLSDKRKVYEVKGLPKASNAAHLARLHRSLRGCSVRTWISGTVSETQRNNRTSLCGRERKTRYALYTLSRFGSSRNVGQAEICVHEFKKAGIMEGKGPSKYLRFLQFFLNFNDFSKIYQKTSCGVISTRGFSTSWKRDLHRKSLFVIHFRKWFFLFEGLRTEWPRIHQVPIQSVLE